MPYNFAAECPEGYEITEEYGSENKICGSKVKNSAGEINMGGPKWPNATSTPAQSLQSCDVETLRETTLLDTLFKIYFI